MRLWTKDESGGFWPSKNGFTVKLRDLPTLGDAVGKALDLALRETGGNTVAGNGNKNERYAHSREGVDAQF